MKIAVECRAGDGPSGAVVTRIFDTETVWVLTPEAFTILTTVAIVGECTIDQVYVRDPGKARTLVTPLTKAIFENEIIILLDKSLLVISYLNAMEGYNDAFVRASKLIFTYWPFCANDYPGFLDRAERWKRCEQTIEVTWTLYEKFKSMRPSDQAVCAVREFALLLADTAWYFHERSRPQRCAETICAVLAVCQASVADCSDIRLDMMGTAGIHCTEVGQSRLALELLSRHLSLRQVEYARTRILTGKHAAAYSELGHAMVANKMWPEARQMFKRSNKIRYKLPDYARVRLFSTRLGKGTIFLFTGEYAKAATEFMGALSDREMVYGRDDQHSYRAGMLLFYLGESYCRDGRSEQASLYQQRAVDQYTNTLGEDHHLTATAMFELAKHHMRTQRIIVAYQLVAKAARIYETKGPFFKTELTRSCLALDSIMAIIRRAMLQGPFPALPHEPARREEDALNAVIPSLLGRARV